MEEFLDRVWLGIVAGAQYLAGLMDRMLEPLHPLGPACTILLLGVLTVCFTKAFSRFYSTKRYRRLQQEFQHWYNLRQEALAAEDREKGRALAKNIDQANLNRVYYDYFFEGLLKNILTIYLPVLCMAAYVNEAFRSDRLLDKFGRAYVFEFTRSGEDPIRVGGLFWFVVVVIFLYATWFLTAMYFRKIRSAFRAHEKNLS